MKFYSFLFLCFLSPLISQDLRIETDILPPDHPNFNQIKKVDFYFNSKNELIKAYYYFTEEWTKENGAVNQMEYYENNIPTKFELFMSEEHIKETNIVRKIDYVDKNDNITKIELITKEGNEWTLTGKNIENLDRFKIKKLDTAISLFEEYGEIGENEYAYEVPLFSFITEIPFSNKIENLTTKELEHIKNYFTGRKAEYMIPHFTKKMEFKYKNRTFILCLQKEHFTTMQKYSSGLFYYYYIGGYKNAIFLLGISYIGSKNQLLLTRP